MIHVSLWINDAKTLTSIFVSVDEKKKKYLRMFQLLKLLTPIQLQDYMKQPYIWLYVKTACILNVAERAWKSFTCQK
jgi:hypothetical protein